MSKIIRLGACEIEIVSQEGRYVGIGTVKIGGVTVRSGQRPMNVEIRDPNGVLVHEYRQTELSETPDEARLKCSMTRLDGGPMEFMLHTVRNRYNTADWSQGAQPLEGQFELVLRPLERTIGETRYVGFSYQYRYHAPSLPIYKILDRGTWEIGGSSVGNEVWMRNGTVSSIMPIESVEDAYSLEWFLPGIQQPNIFQFFPLQGTLQGFTMTWHDAGVLLTWPNEVAHTRTLIEKTSGSDRLVHWHEHCGDLSETFATPPVEVLFAPVANASRVGRTNVWEDARALIWGELHRQIGMGIERVEPYGVMEEWGVPDLARYRELGLPKMAAAGIKKIMIPNEFQNNMNVFGVSNMCCTVDLKVAETVGEVNLRDFCSSARQQGMRIEMWGNTSLSTLTEIFSRRDGDKKRIDFLPFEGSAMDRITASGDPWVRNLSGAIEADHYTPVFACMNLRKQAVRDYWLESWRYAHTQIGLEGIFVDSSFNLSADKFHFMQNAGGRGTGATIDQTHLLGATRPKRGPKQAVHSQFRAYLDLMVEMQKLGYSIAAEDLGLFGVSRSGPDVARRWKCLPLWVETLCNFDVEKVRDMGEDPDHVYFAGLAYRLMWYLYWTPEKDALSHTQYGPQNDDDKPTEYHFRLLKAFAEVSPLMVDRHIADDEAWVRYRKNGQECYWALKDSTVALGGSRHIREVVTGTEARGETLAMTRHHVYVVSA